MKTICKVLYILLLLILSCPCIFLFYYVSNAGWIYTFGIAIFSLPYILLIIEAIHSLFKRKKLHKISQIAYILVFAILVFVPLYTIIGFAPHEVLYIIFCLVPYSLYLTQCIRHFKKKKIITIINNISYILLCIISYNFYDMYNRTLLYIILGFLIFLFFITGIRNYKNNIIN